MIKRMLLAGLLLLVSLQAGLAAPPRLSAVTPGKTLAFPRDFGAHPDYRTEWWYVTGWLQTPDGKPIGFQVTFFRSATDHDPANPSRLAPKQLIIAHAALSDPAAGRLLHDQRSARAGFDLAYAKEGTTDVALNGWRFFREADGRYRAQLRAREFEFDLAMAPTQPLLLQGEQAYSRKGPRPEQASYYYSEPQLKVGGSIVRNGQPLTVTGSAWLDHEWSTSVLDADAAGWDWIGANLDDGSALMAFQIRSRDGARRWAHATLRSPDGKLRQFGPDEVAFEPVRRWQSPRTGASYPVAQRLVTGDIAWELQPLQDDQELDSRQSTGAIYWEGATTLLRGGQRAGRGYLEMTGYAKPMKL